MARILLIEDEEPVRTTLRLTLEQLGHTVVEARNGTEGLALFQPATIDVVITDMVMPEYDGLEVVRALRNQHPPVNIIAISGAGIRAEDYLEWAHLLGAGKVLLKPFSNDALRAAIYDLLPGGGAPPPVSP